MALKDLLSLFDAKLKDTFHHKAYDPAADRAKMAKRLEATKSKFLATEPPRGKRDFNVSNNVVEWTPATPGGGTLFEDGTVYVPAERFAEALDRTAKLVDAGEFDARLKSDGETGSAPKAPRATRKPRDPAATKREGGGSREWTPERREAFAKTIAARKAAKAG